MKVDMDTFTQASLKLHQLTLHYPQQSKCLLRAHEINYRSYCPYCNSRYSLLWCRFRWYHTAKQYLTVSIYFACHLIYSIESHGLVFACTAIALSITDVYHLCSPAQALFGMQSVGHRIPFLKMAVVFLFVFSQCCHTTLHNLDGSVQR